MSPLSSLPGGPLRTRQPSAPLPPPTGALGGSLHPPSLQWGGLYGESPPPHRGEPFQRSKALLPGGGRLLEALVPFDQVLHLRHAASQLRRAHDGLLRHQPGLGHAGIAPEHQHLQHWGGGKRHIWGGLGAWRPPPTPWVGVWWWWARTDLQPVHLLLPAGTDVLPALTEVGELLRDLGGGGWGQGG